MDGRIFLGYIRHNITLFNVWDIFELKLYNQVRSQSGFLRSVNITICIVRRKW